MTEETSTLGTATHPCASAAIGESSATFARPGLASRLARFLVPLVLMASCLVGAAWSYRRLHPVRS